MKGLRLIFRILICLVFSSTSTDFQAQGWLQTFEQSVHEFEDFVETPDGYMVISGGLRPFASHNPFVKKFNKFGELQWVKNDIRKSFSYDVWVDDGINAPYLSHIDKIELNYGQQRDYNINISHVDNPDCSQNLQGHWSVESCTHLYKLESEWRDEDSHRVTLVFQDAFEESYSVYVDDVLTIYEFNAEEAFEMAILGDFNSNQTYTIKIVNTADSTCWSSRTIKRDCSSPEECFLAFNAQCPTVYDCLPNADNLSFMLVNNKDIIRIKSYKVYQSDDGGFFIALSYELGAEWNSYIPSTEWTYNFLQKYDSSGDLEWSKDLNEPVKRPHKYFAFAKAENDNYYLTYLSDTTNFQIEVKIHYLEFDLNGNTIFETETEHPIPVSLYDGNDPLHLAISSTGKRIIAGEFFVNTIRKSIMYSFDSEGNFLWTNEELLDTLQGYGIEDIKFGSEDEIYFGDFLVGMENNLNRIRKFDFETGEELWTYIDTFSNSIPDIGFQILSDNGVAVIYRREDYTPLGSELIVPEIYKLNSDGILTESDLLHDHYSALFESGHSMFSISMAEVYSTKFVACDDGSFVIGGRLTNLSNEGNNSPFVSALMKLDENGLIWSSKLCGTVFKDENENCLKDEGEIPLKNILLETSPGSIYAISDSLGEFCFLLNEGNYEINSSLNENLWEASCQENSLSFDLGSFDTIQDFDIGFQPIVDCPLLSVSMGHFLARRCFEAYFKIDYCNNGTIAEENASIDLELDALLSITNASVEYESLGDDVYSFDIGLLGVNECGTIQVNYYTSCDAVLGSTVCSDVKIYPLNSCLDPDPLWDLSDIEVDGSCLGDSVEFIIRNISEAMDSPRKWAIYEDNLLSEQGDFELPAYGELSMRFPSVPSTYRFTAEQSPFYPENSMPQAFVEFCGPFTDFSSEIINSYMQDDLPAHIDIECGTVVSSCDPNDKLVVPTGLGPDHFTSPNDDFEYTIRFQNVGNDTAFNVFILDTLSEHLDVSTFRSEVSSHSYSVDIIEGNIIRWNFDNILLVDSFANEPLSHGFVKFSISQKPGNENWTLIENSASIYFDFNLPVITPTVFNTIMDPPYAGELVCGDFDLSHEIVCNTAENNYKVKLQPSGGSTDNEIYEIVDHQSGDRFILENANGLELGPFDIGTGLLYSVHLFDYPSCYETLSRSSIECIDNGLENKPQTIEFNVFPNPSREKLNLLMDCNSEAETFVKIYNPMGQSILEEKLDCLSGQTVHRMDLKGIPNGLYLIQISQDDKQITKRFLKE